MVSRQHCPVFSAALAAALLAAVGAGVVAGAPATATAPAATQRGLPRGEFGTMIGMFKLEGEPRERFLAAYRTWEDRVDALHAGATYRKILSLDPEIAKAREAKDEARLAKLVAEQKALLVEYWKVRSDARAHVILSLAPELQQQWVSVSMYNRAHRGLRRAELTPVQIEKIRSLCDEETAIFLKEHPTVIKDDPYLKTLGQPADHVIDRARLEVLDDAQREKVPSRGTIPPKAAATDGEPNTSQ